jgi:hypothetical protein
MTELESYLWLVTPLAAIAAAVLSFRMLLPIAALAALTLVKRYFRFLIPVPDAERAEAGEYLTEARALALGDGFEFVNTYRPFRGPRVHRLVDVWRADDLKTIALVSEGAASRNETILVSALEDGRRLTTTDNSHAGDPRGFGGVLARPGATFRELCRTHRARVSAHQAEPVSMGGSDPVAVIEDLDRSLVQRLVESGLARYRNERQTSWSYTLRGGYEVYYLARPKIVRTAPDAAGKVSSRAAD